MFSMTPFQAYKSKDKALALISKKRGTNSNHQLKEGVKSLVLKVIYEKYKDFGSKLAHEKLTLVHKFKLSIFTVRKIIMEEGLFYSGIQLTLKISYVPKILFVKGCLPKLRQIERAKAHNP